MNKFAIVGLSVAASLGTIFVLKKFVPSVAAMLAL
jgi:hypothetical protein